MLSCSFCSVLNCACSQGSQSVKSGQLAMLSYSMDMQVSNLTCMACAVTHTHMQVA